LPSSGFAVSAAGTVVNRPNASAAYPVSVWRSAAS
jgi:hypothetical protein